MSTPSIRIRPSFGSYRRHDQLEQRGLPRAVPADHSERLARPDCEAQVGERRLVGSRIGEGDVLELDLTTHRRRNLDRRCFDRHRGLGLHELEQVVQVQVVLVHPGEAAEDALNRALHRLRRGRVQRQVAEAQAPADRLQRHIEIGDRCGDRADVAQPESSQVAPGDLGSLAGVVARRR